MDSYLRDGTRVSDPPVERRSGRDRRGELRAGQPGRRATDKARACAFVALWGLMLSSAAAAQSGAMKFGFDATSASRAQALGMPVSYGSLWAGNWNRPDKDGWGGIRTQLKAAKASGVTPVVQWFYWGDDISPTCVENGCTGRYDGGRKDKASWYRMSHELADLIAEVMGRDSGTLVVIETEFNKGGIGRYEPFDGYLADHMRIFHDRGVKVILGFGNWDRHLWGNFDRAVASADLIGVMALQSSVRDATTYLSGAEMLISAARYNQATFHKPSFVTDFAFSSYPDPGYERDQDIVIREIFARVDELRAAGVEGMVWRMLADDPKFNTANYHGVAERHWGLLRADGSRKPAFQPFLNGMLSEKARAVEAPTPEPNPHPEPSPAFDPEPLVDPAT